MNNYLTTFSNIAAYNQFLDSNDCPPVNVSYITSTSEVKYYKDTPNTTPFTIEIDLIPDDTLYETGIYPKFNLIIQDSNYSAGKKKIWLKYKINNGSWVEYPETWDSTEGLDVRTVNIPTALHEGDKISFISNNMHLSCHFNNENWFLDQGIEDIALKISGNIMSLSYGDDYLYATPDAYEGNVLYFGAMFENSNFLHDASDLVLPTHNLPAGNDDYWTNYGAFKRMFKNCANLQDGPTIKALDLPYGACMGMFEGCVSLQEIPVILTKSAAGSAFFNMFKGCYSLTSVDFSVKMPNLEKISGTNTFTEMFLNCSNTDYDLGLQSINGIGDLVSNITYASDIDRTYAGMFQNCTFLDITDDSEVFDTHNIPENIGAKNIFANMFDGCTSLTHTPVFNYTSLDNPYMFNNCGSITHLYWLSHSWDNKYFGDNWSAAEGTLYYGSSLEYDPSSVVPSGWTAVAYTPSNP